MRRETGRGRVHPRCLRVLLHVHTGRAAAERSSTTSTSTGPGGSAMTSPSEAGARRRGSVGTAGLGCRRAHRAGTGADRGSLGIALRKRGWHVTGRDADPAPWHARALARALDEVGDDPEAEISSSPPRRRSRPR